MPEREPMLAATYLVVAFSVLAQGTTVGPLMRRWLGSRPAPDAPLQREPS